MIRCAVFDADGTLIDSLGVWREADEVYFKSLGLELTDEIYAGFLDMTYGESIAYVKKRFSLPGSEKQISDGIMKIVAEKYETEVKLVPDAEPFIRSLHALGIPMAIATANDKELVKKALLHNGILDLFSYIVTCDETGTNKNSADVYIRAASLLGFSPGETLVVEDDEKYVRVAREAGFTAVHISELRRLDLGKH